MEESQGEKHRSVLQEEKQECQHRMACAQGRARWQTGSSGHAEEDGRISHTAGGGEGMTPRFQKQNSAAQDKSPEIST